MKAVEVVKVGMTKAELIAQRHNDLMVRIHEVQKGYDAMIESSENTLQMLTGNNIRYTNK